MHGHICVLISSQAKLCVILWGKRATVVGFLNQLPRRGGSYDKYLRIACGDAHPGSDR